MNRRSSYHKGASGGGPAPTPLITVTSIEPTSIYQWSSSSTLNVYGAGFTAGSNITINGNNVSATTLVDSTHITCTITSAETASSILQTAGTLSVSVSNKTDSSYVNLSIVLYTYDTLYTPTLYLDPAVGNITIETGVSAWNDSSLHNHDMLQATTTDQPSYVSSVAALNNKPALTFDGTSQWINCTSDLAVFSPTRGGMTVFCVFEPLAITANAGSTSLNKNNPVLGALIAPIQVGLNGLYLDTTNSNTLNIISSASSAYMSFTGINVNQGYIAEFKQHILTNSFGRITFAGYTSGVASNTSWSQFGIGGNVGTGVFSNIRIAHILVYPVMLPNVDSDRIYRKLKNYYAL